MRKVLNRFSGLIVTVALVLVASGDLGFAQKTNMESSRSCLTRAAERRPLFDKAAAARDVCLSMRKKFMDYCMGPDTWKNFQNYFNWSGWPLPPLVSEDKIIDFILEQSGYALRVNENPFSKEWHGGAEGACGPSDNECRARTTAFGSVDERCFLISEGRKFIDWLRDWVSTCSNADYLQKLAERHERELKKDCKNTDSMKVRLPRKPSTTSSAKLPLPDDKKTGKAGSRNLDRFDLGPSFVGSDAPSGSKATRRAGGGGGTTKTWAPGGAATGGGTTTWAPAGAKQ